MDTDPKSVAEPVREEFTVSFIPDDVSGRQVYLGTGYTRFTGCNGSFLCSTYSFIYFCLFIIDISVSNRSSNVGAVPFMNDAKVKEDKVAALNLRIPRCAMRGSAIFTSQDHGGE